MQTLAVTYRNGFYVIWNFNATEEHSKPLAPNSKSSNIIYS